MLFNSAAFACFIFIVFGLYWSRFFRQLKRQNILLIAAGFIFYGWWSWYFLSFLLFTSIVDYLVALRIEKNTGSRNRQRLWLTISVVCNLGVLGYFKYANFFIRSFLDAAAGFGWHPGIVLTEIILPVGISFYTFQAMAYTIDVYRGSQKACSDFIAYLAYIAFFPQLAAGPVERARRMLVQFTSERIFSYSQASDGLRLLLWGLIKKVVIADNVARFVNLVYTGNHPSSADAATAIFFFTIQIYADFSGYSDMARGLGKLLGFELSVNFRTPFFADSMRDFWARWHISLSTWFRDYLYVPLGGNRSFTVWTWILPAGIFLGAMFYAWRQLIVAENFLPLIVTLFVTAIYVTAPVRHRKMILLTTNLNLLITFLLSGLWHGANWTFVFWGALHGTALVFERAFGEKKIIPTSVKQLIVFLIVCFAFHFFRAINFGQAFAFCESILHPDTSAVSQLTACYGSAGLLIIFLLIGFFFMAEWMIWRGMAQRLMERWPRRGRWSLYYAGVLLILLFGVTESPGFIYFQF